MNLARTMAAMLFLVAWPRPAHPAEDAPFARKRVLVLVVRDFQIDPNTLFWDTTPQGQATADADLNETIKMALSAEPEVEAMWAQDALASGRQGRRSVARGFLHLGIELYRNLRVDDAVKALEKGVEAGRTEFLDLSDPRQMFDLYFYLGLSYVEQGRTALAHVAFKNMFLVAPQEASRRMEFRRGYLPSAAEEAIRTAVVDFVETSPQEVPLGSLERVADLLKITGTTALVDVFVGSGPGGKAVLSVRVFETVPGERSVRQVLSRRNQFANIEHARDLLSRDISAWLACTDLPSRTPQRERLPRFYLDTTGVYSIFLQHKPTRNVFHNAGFGFGLSYQILKEMDFFVRWNISTSFPDKYNDLIAGFTGIRLHTGVGYTLCGKWGRFFVHTGLDMQYLTDFASTTDPACKIDAWRANPEFCKPEHVVSLPYRLLGGSALVIGVDVNLFGPIYVTFKVGAAIYFFPAGPASPLNFPLIGETGLGYAFF